MRFSFFVAKRYFLSKRKKNFINYISILSMLAVAFATAALIIVLSVFNGLGDLLRSLNTSVDPEIKIEAAKGKSFEVTEELLSKIKSVEGVKIVTEVIEDYAYVRYRDADMVVTIRGVSENFLEQHRLDTHLVDGQLILTQDSLNFAIIGRGIQYALTIGVEEALHPLQVFYIKTLKPGSLEAPYKQRLIQPGGVFSIEKNYDENFIFLPLRFAQDLLDYKNRRTSLEVMTNNGEQTQQVAKTLKSVLGKNLSVLTNEEQHKDLYRLLKFEKLFTFMSLVLLIFIASINIFFSLMMLVIEKKKDISILISLGADPSLIKRIFFNEGALIALLGAGAGLILGGLICWLQDRFGLIGMGMENAIVSAYPVKMKLSDFAITSFSILIITLIISFYPSHLAARSYSIREL